MTRLHQIQNEVALRAEAITLAHGAWPCQKGCDDCCRSLASEPRVTESEWKLIDRAIAEMPTDTASEVRQRIRDGARRERPVVCPMLDTKSGACLIYAARPIACRTYGFYAERSEVLGCHRIESLAKQSPEVIWGNHTAVESDLRKLGTAKELSVWLDSEN
jgi:Fe-S-cluster containining protein